MMLNKYNALRALQFHPGYKFAEILLFKEITAALFGEG